MKQNKQAFIKLYKKIRDWEWSEDPFTFKIFIDCLLRANWKDGSWKGIEFKRGQFIASFETLSKDNGMTRRNIRTSISRLEMTGEVTRKRHGKYTIFTVNNYNLYQSNDQQNDHDLTRCRPDADQQVTLDEEYKEEKRKKEKENISPEEKRRRMIERQLKEEAEEYERITGQPWKD